MLLIHLTPEQLAEDQFELIVTTLLVTKRRILDVVTSSEFITAKKHIVAIVGKVRMEMLLETLFDQN